MKERKAVAANYKQNILILIIKHILDVWIEVCHTLLKRAIDAFFYTVYSIGGDIWLNSVS
jgi:hypothetical protein